MTYKKEDIEFAFRLLNDRESVPDSAVEEWMKDPAHWRLLNDMEAVRQKVEQMEGESETEKIAKALEEQRSRRMTMRWSMIIVLILVLGLFAVKMMNLVNS